MSERPKPGNVGAGAADVLVKPDTPAAGSIVGGTVGTGQTDTGWQVDQFLGGDEEAGDPKPEKPKPPKDYAATWDDGYKMRGVPGGFILEAPDGSFATWDSEQLQWVHPAAGTPMPPAWSGGHAPGTQFKSSSK